MTVGSLFSGVGGFDLAFEQAGFETIWMCEKDKFCQAVLRTHWPQVKLYEDVAEVTADAIRPDVVTFGFPCQDLSVAGQRAGLEGSRSGLFWGALRVLREVRPRWAVIENVPGLHSSDSGYDFSRVLRGLGELGLFQSIAWTTLDSRYFAVAQQRKRIFLVAGPRVGDAEAVLFEREGCAWHPAESEEERPDVADCLDGSPYADRESEERKLVARNISASMGHHGHSSPRGDGSDNLVAATLNSGGNSGGFRTEPGEHLVGYALRQDPGGTGQGHNTSYVVASPITASYGKQVDSSNRNGGPPNLISAPPDAHGMRDATEFPAGMDDSRFPLLPKELDSPRYRALGNAVTVSVVRWIAERIKARALLV